VLKIRRSHHQTLRELSTTARMERTINLCVLRALPTGAAPVVRIAADHQREVLIRPSFAAGLQGVRHLSGIARHAPGCSLAHCPGLRPTARLWQRWPNLSLGTAVECRLSKRGGLAYLLDQASAIWLASFSGPG